VGIIDYWCNSFDPGQRALWDEATRAQGLPIRVREDRDDSFASPKDMVARMDALGIDTLLLPSTEVPEKADAIAYERYTTPPEQVERLAADFPGRFVGLWSLDPSTGHPGVQRAAEALAASHFVGLHFHTHSWDRAFDDRDYYPHYALAADLGVPVVMQAGTSGGLMPSQCGQPIGIDRPALYFADVPFVLSHTGWPWCDEAIAMAQKHPNVYLGTAAWPPNHWTDSVVRFLRGPGRGKTLFGTGFPVVGHRQALSRLDTLELDGEPRAQLLEGTARKIFARLPASGGQDR
jgi:predicted TIM-barrel fold metal-dependent hydrolase